MSLPANGNITLKMVKLNSSGEFKDGKRNGHWKTFNAGGTFRVKSFTTTALASFANIMAGENLNGKGISSTKNVRENGSIIMRMENLKVLVNLKKAKGRTSDIFPMEIFRLKERWRMI